MKGRYQILSGWAGAHHGNCFVVPVASADECRSAVEECRRRGMTVGFRGSGCSFGDSPVNSENAVLDLRAMASIERFDEETGVLEAQAGATISEILRRCLPCGWLLPSVPGGLAITLGGALSHNVHGKDAAVRGNIGRHALWVDLMTADGSVKRLSRERDPEEFLAVIGGMGLCGVVLRAAVQLVRIPSARLEVETRVTGGIAATLAAMEEATGCDYGQAWYDASATGARAGRGVVKLARFVPSRRSIDPAELARSLTESDTLFGLLPAKRAWRAARPLLTPPWMTAVNAGYYHVHRFENLLAGGVKDELFTSFYFFHNNLPGFYSAYQPPGFLHVQVLVPKSAGPEAFASLIEQAQRAVVPPVLGGIKRHSGDDFLLSFSGDGYSISFDYSLVDVDINALMAGIRELYERVVEFGGMENLSKDQWLPRDLFRRMYPSHERFWAVKRRLDPQGLFNNDAGRRLFG